jgi:hypothetical protein
MTAFGAQGGATGAISGGYAETVGAQGEPWVYNRMPGEARYAGGTASGGWCILPPEVSLADSDYGFVPPGVTTSASVFGVGPGAWFFAGVPCLANGSILTGFSWGMDTATGDLIWNAHDNGTVSTCYKFDLLDRRISWKSDTNFWGSILHFNTDARWWTFPDASGTLVLGGDSGVANRVAYWSAVHTLSSDGDFLWDPAANILAVIGSVGIGTSTVPHGAVGAAKLAIDGANTSTAGPHIQITTATDNYPLFQGLFWEHGSVGLMFDAYYDGTYRSSSVDANYHIFKTAATFKIQGDSGIALGAAITWDDLMILTAAGNVTFSGTVTSSGLTPTHVVYAGAGGLLTGSANMTFSGTNLLITGTEQVTRLGIGAAADGTSPLYCSGTANPLAILSNLGSNAVARLSIQAAADGSPQIDFIQNAVQSAYINCCRSAGLGIVGSAVGDLLFVTQVHNILFSTNNGTTAAFGITTSADLVYAPGNQWYPSADSVTALQLTKANGSTVIVNVDTTNGRFGVGPVATAPAAYFHVKESAEGNPEFGSQVVVESSGEAYINILGGDSSQTALWFGDGADANRGGLIYDQNSDQMRFRALGATKMTLDTTGLGIGTTADRKLDVADASNPQCRITRTDGTVFADFETSATIALKITGVSYKYLEVNETLLNTSLGYAALQSNTTGTYNSAMGMQALYSNTEGNYNSAMGVNALYSNTTGTYNSAMGMNALRSNTTGGYNSAMGLNALRSNTTGGYNSAMGMQALRYNTTGGYNSAMGMHALQSNTEGNYNSAMGMQALYDVTDGIYNTGVGFNTGCGITTGDYNTILGAQVTGLAADLQNTIILADGQGLKQIWIDRINGFVWNDGHGDYDYRVSGDTCTYGIFLEANAASENIALLTGSAPNWQTMDRGIFQGESTTAPTGNPAAGFFAYGADWNGAGTCVPFFRGEDGSIVKLFTGVTIADPAGGGVVDAEARTAINALIDRLQGCGLIA